MNKFKTISSMISALAFTAIAVTGLSGITSCDAYTDKALVIDSKPIKTQYKVGETLDLSGLVIVSKNVVGGYLSNDDVEAITEYKTSIESGSILEKEGTHTITISKFGYKSTSFEITVGEEIVTKRLEIMMNPQKVTYDVGDKFRTRGLIVNAVTYKGDTKVNTETAVEFTTNPIEGTVLDTEGSFVVEISFEGYESTYYSISVKTGDTTLYNLVQTLQNSHNYKIEVYNTVSTTVDNYGFHYEQTYTEDYFDRITYKKRAADEPEDERGLSGIKSEFAYVNTVNEGEGCYEVNFVNSEAVPSKPYSLSKSWWDLNLISDFNVFDLKSVPTSKTGDRFIIETYLDETEKENNAGVENPDWTNTLKDNKFGASFLSLAGWSDSLIEILDYVEVTTNGRDELFMKGYLSDYGYTTIKLLNINDANVAKVDEYMATPDRTYNKELDNYLATNNLIEAINGYNYSMELIPLEFETGESGPIGTAYFTENGFAVVPADYIRDIGTSEEMNINTFGVMKDSTTNVLSSFTASYINSNSKDEEIRSSNVDEMSETNLDNVRITNQIVSKLGRRSYISYLNKTIGKTLSDPSINFQYYTDSVLGTEEAPFILGRTEQIMSSFGTYLEDYYGTFLDGGIDVSDYSMAAITPILGDDGLYETIEFWILDSSYRGFIVSLYDFGKTTLPEFVLDYMNK